VHQGSGGDQGIDDRKRLTSRLRSASQLSPSVGHRDINGQHSAGKTSGQFFPHPAFDFSPPGGRWKARYPFLKLTESQDAYVKRTFLN
jgi:hypothetical protein